MKALFKLLLLSVLLLISGILFAASVSDSTNVIPDQQEAVEESGYFDEEINAKANKTIRQSEMALENIMKDPDNAIPPSLIDQSEGIIIFPRALKIAFGHVGGQAGKGIAMIRLDDGSWSNPFFVTLGEASVGFQIGAQKSDLVLLFRNRNDIISIDEADIMLGSGVGVTAGPVSKGSSSATDITFDSEIYSYSHSKGLFAGISLNGGVLSNNGSYNESLYRMSYVETDNIFFEIDAPYNDKVNNLIATINTYSE